MSRSAGRPSLAALGCACALLAFFVGPARQVHDASDGRGAVRDRASFTLVAGGDVLIHQEIGEQALRDGGGVPNFVPQLSNLARPLTAAALAICHLEVPLASRGGPYAGYPSFDAPPEIAQALAEIGYDGCSTASNHSLDQGREGVVRTLDTLDAAGLAHAGTARSPNEATRPTIYHVGRTRIAHLSYSYDFNRDDLLTSEPWLANRLEPDAVMMSAAAAKAAGADVVVLSAHWGTEYQPWPNADQLNLAREFLANPNIDLVIGHHAHVVQPFERIGHKWVAYGLGDQIAHLGLGETEEGVLARFTFTRVSDGQWVVSLAEYLPMYIDLGLPIRVVDLSTAARTPRTDAALERIDTAVLSRGAADAGLSRPRP